MRKNCKKFISSLLAFAMIFSIGMPSVASYAAEDDAKYTVSLAECENGKIEFDGSTDGTYAAGEKVSLKLIADEGYIASGISIKETASNEEIISKSTDDDLFSFTMPKANLTVKALFRDYEETVPEEELTLEDEVASDLIIEDYIKDNIDSKYISSIEICDLINVFHVRNMLTDGNLVEPTDTVDSIQNGVSNNDINEISKWYGQIETDVAVYDLNTESDYVVAHINTMDDVAKVQDVIFALNDNDGHVIDNIIYDYDTGIAYIPRDLFIDEDNNYLVLGLQAQLLQVIGGDLTDIESEVDSVVIDDDSADIYSTVENIFSMQTDVQTEAGLNEDEITVVVNGIPVTEEAYDYNADTGIVSLSASSAAIESVSVFTDGIDVDEDIDASIEIEGDVQTYNASHTGLLGSWSNAKRVAEDVQLPNWVTAGTALYGNIYTSEHSYYNEQATDANTGYSFNFSGSYPTNMDYELMARMISGISSSYGYTISSNAPNSLVAQYDALYLMVDWTDNELVYTANVANNTYKGSINPEGQSIPALADIQNLYLRCGHISTESGLVDEEGGVHGPYKVPAYARFMYIDWDSGFAVLGVLTSEFNSQNGTTFFVIGIAPSTGYATMTKASANTSITNGNDCYNLAGIQYKVYEDEACTTQAKDADGNNAVLTIKSDGTANVLEMEQGTYYVLEDPSSITGTGYYEDSTPHPITISSDNTEDNPATITVTDNPMNDPAGIKIYKIDAETGKPDPQGGASLEGAEFTVKFYAGDYSESEIASMEPTRTWVLQTKYDAQYDDYYAEFLDDYKVSGDDWYYDTDGVGIVLPLGTYTIQETSAPEGYLVKGGFTYGDEELGQAGEVFYTQLLDEGDAVWIEGGNEYTESDTVIRGGVAVQKRDAQSLRDDPQGDGSFEGIEVTITNDNENSVLVEDEEYAPGEVVYTMYTDEDGYAETASDLLPYGHYILTETDVPSGMVGIDNDGYLEGNGSHDDAIVQSVTVIEFDIEKDGVIVNKTEEDDSLTDLVKRGDFYLEKHNEETQQPMSVPFRVTSKTTGESHVFWTDMNGDYSSDSTWAKHTYKTDLGEDYTDGFWFYGYADEEESGVEVDDALGALPYDTYILDELPCEANEGMELVEGVEFTVYQDVRELDLGQYYNKTAAEAKFVTNASNPNLNDLQYVCADNHAVIKDSITYEGLDEDATYTYVMKLWDNTVSDFIKDPETGEDLMLMQEMTPNGLTEGTFTMEMLFDATGLENHTVTVFQYLYSEDGELLLAEDDEANTDEQIYFPYLHTELTTEAGHHMALADGTVTFADMVWYENFPENTEVTIVGYLYYYDEDSEDHIGDVVIDANGNEVIGVKTFWNTSTSGEVEVDFEFDDSLLEGREIVASEHAFVNGVRIGYELDASDYAEMMLFPHLGTTALDSETEDHISLADNTVTIVDHVTYDHVYPGKTLTLETTIMNAETGEALVDENGDAITVTQEFTPEESSGAIDVTLTFDASEYAGTTTVVFEYLYADDELVGQHADLTDEGQTVYLPNVTTQAIVDSTGTQDALALSTVDVTDAVTYDHLMPNADYTLVSYIVDAETGEKLVDADGNAVTVTTPIHTNEAGDGEVDVEVEFDASGLDGDTVVMTCYLYLGTDEAATDTSTTETPTDTDDDELEYVESETESSITGGGEATLTFADGADEEDGETIDPDEIEPGIVETDGDGETVDPDEIEPGIVEPGDDNDGETVDPDEIEPGPVEEDPDSTTTTNSEAMLVAVHDDLDDTDEWIVFHAPVIGTEALDDTTGTHYAYALEKEGITDTVHYEDLLEGQEYVMTGYPVDKETGEALTEPVSTEFTAESSEGDVEIHVDLDLSDYAGKEIVFYEELYYVEDEIAEHKDINDEDQTIIILNPTIQTHAVDKDGNKNVTIGETTIVDTVDYEGLVAGQEYTMVGQIYDKETGEAIEGASGNVVFTAGEEEVIVSEDADEEAEADAEEETEMDTDAAEETETEASKDLVSGSVDVEVTLDTTSFADHDLVFFEELYVGSEDIAEDSTPIAVHKDIDDEDQTVHVGGPKIHTMATDKNGNKEVEATVVELVDTVSYEGLKAGEEYTMVGEIYDKTTGTAIAGTQTSVDFTAEASEGEMQVEVEFDATDYAGKDLVFFEKLYTKDDSSTPIASHEDINDADQTIHVKEAALVNLSNNAKTAAGIGLGVLAVLLVAGVVGYTYYKKKRLV